MTSNIFGYILRIQELDLFCCQLLPFDLDRFVNPFDLTKPNDGPADSFLDCHRKRYLSHTRAFHFRKLLDTTDNLDIGIR